MYDFCIFAIFSNTGFMDIHLCAANHQRNVYLSICLATDFSTTEQIIDVKFYNLASQHLPCIFENFEVMPLAISKCVAKKRLRWTIFGLSDAHFTHLTVIMLKTVHCSVSHQCGLKVNTKGAFQKSKIQDSCLRGIPIGPNVFLSWLFSHLDSEKIAAYS